MKEKKNIALRLITFIIAFQVLNMSIDAPGAQIQNSHEHGSFNYIESYVEYVAEVILQFDNAIPETNKRQQKELQLHKQINIVCQSIQTPKTEFTFNRQLSKEHLTYSDNYACQFINEINPPPPKF